jgi:hypothetical protein
MNQLYYFRSANEHYPESIDHLVVNPRKYTRIEGEL